MNKGKGYIRLGTYISRDSYYALKELCEVFRSQTNALDYAIRLLYSLYKSKTRINFENIILREEIIDGFDCILITKKNFSNLISRNMDKFYDEDFIYALAKNVLKKPPEESEINELVQTLRKIYVDSVRWFTEISMFQTKNGYEISFLHTENEIYSEFFARYFSNFFSKLRFEIDEIDIEKKFFSIILKDKVKNYL